MRTIRMLTTEPVRTEKGIVYYMEGKEYEASDANASSLIGRGMAVEVVMLNGKEQDRSALEGKTLKELRALVAPMNIKGYTLLTREGLLDILCPVDVQAES